MRVVGWPPPSTFIVKLMSSTSNGLYNRWRYSLRCWLTKAQSTRSCPFQRKPIARACSSPCGDQTILGVSSIEIDEPRPVRFADVLSASLNKPIHYFGRSNMKEHDFHLVDILIIIVLSNAAEISGE